MTSYAKGRETLKRKVLDLLHQSPGTPASSMTKAQASVLREMELAGLIRYGCKQPGVQGWFIDDTTANDGPHGRIS